MNSLILFLRGHLFSICLISMKLVHPMIRESLLLLFFFHTAVVSSIYYLFFVKCDVTRGISSGDSCFIKKQ